MTSISYELMIHHFTNMLSKFRISLSRTNQKGETFKTSQLNPTLRPWNTLYVSSLLVGGNEPPRGLRDDKVDEEEDVARGERVPQHVPALFPDGKI